ncbi:TIGR02444 family protein [Pseudomonas entomophila]|uniref:TIGR02444 family protein n=1 Tax=Pseudomonas entomophila TaxID=312306 RepID=UPI0023D7C04A|nr:TIGR02444 family protein [Pseudomonas entomophila]MDF0734197.1 TIGR02444 family protein [Pseudomonas entomophila]
MRSELWNHAVALYARPGVEAACLALQAQGADVCLLLCGTWLQARRVLPDAGRIDVLRAIAGPWQARVVTPLRALRQQWRADAAHDQQWAVLREQLKKLELDAERTLLARLEEVAQGWPASPQGPTGDWLAWLVPEPTCDHDALHQLRVAATELQDAVDGD